MNQDLKSMDDELEDCAVEVALFALGALPEENARAVEQRLRSGCPFCLAKAEHYALVAEQLALSVSPVQPPPELRSKLLNRIKSGETSAALLEHRKVVRVDESAWVKMPIPGVEVRPLIGQKTFLVRMQPGAVYPKHDHPHAEQCLVLDGSITDSDGLTLHAGDFIVMSRGTSHDPIRSTTGCTLFIAYAD